MTESSYPFAPPGPGAQLNADQWRLLARVVSAYVPGVLPGELNQLAAFGDGTGPWVKLPSGVCAIVGHLYLNDTEFQVPVGSNGTGAIRWDRLVVEADFGAKLLRAKVLPGTNNPAGPALVQDRTTKWQVHLAFIRVPVAMTVIAGADVFLARDRWARGVGDDPVGTTIEHTAVTVPVGFEKSYGQRADWHYYPKLRAAWPTFQGTDPEVDVSYGFDAGTNEVVFPDHRGRVVAGIDTMGGFGGGNLDWVANGPGQLGGRAFVQLTAAQTGEHSHAMTINVPAAASSQPGGNWHLPGIDRPISENIVPISDGVNTDPYFMPSANWANQLAIATGFARDGVFIRHYHLDLAPVTVDPPAFNVATGLNAGGANHPNVQATITHDKLVRLF